MYPYTPKKLAWYEYRVGQHKVTLWALIAWLSTMLVFGIGRMAQTLGDVVIVVQVC